LSFVIENPWGEPRGCTFAVDRSQFTVEKSPTRELYGAMRTSRKVSLNQSNRQGAMLSLRAKH